MIFRRENYDYEIELDGRIDFGFWALPFSMCWFRIDGTTGLKYEFDLLFRFFCFQCSFTMWKWEKGWTDTECTTVEDMING